MTDRRRTKGRVLLDVHIPGAWFLGVLAGLVLLLVIVVAVFSSLNKIATCDVCHVIKPEVVAYKQSAHYKAGVGCQKCHTKPGVFNYFIRNLQGVTNVILYVSNTYQRPITSYVGDASCTQCHPNSQIEKDIVVGNIRVNHKGLRQAGYQCLTCHESFAKLKLSPRVTRLERNPHDGHYPDLDCNNCHHGHKAQENYCDSCHK